MNSTAIVSRIEDNKIYLMHIKDYGEKEKTERSFWNIKKQDFRADNSNKLKLKTGDAVEYYIPEGKTILASFTVLILPLITFLVIFGLLSKFGLESEKVKALLSLIAMVLSFSTLKVLKRVGFKETLPTIIKVVNQDTLNSIKSSCSDCGSCTACD